MDFYIKTISRHINEKVIAQYVKNRGKEKEYEVLDKDNPLNLF